MTSKNRTNSNVIYDIDDYLDDEMLAEEESELDSKASTTVQEAIIRTIFSQGSERNIDIRRVAALCNRSPDEVIEEARGFILQNPDTWNEDPYGGWETSGEYLADNVYKKALLLKTASRRYPGRFSANVAAIKPFIPFITAGGIGIEDISFTLGSPWVPDAVLNAFIQQLFDYWQLFSRGNTIFIERSEKSDKRIIAGKSRTFGEVESYQTYGTTRVPALKIVEASLNNRVVAVWEDGPARIDNKGKVTYPKVLNLLETDLAREKQLLVESAFIDWATKTPEVATYIAKTFNAQYGFVQRRHYDSSFIKDFPGKTKEIELFDHQKAAVVRILLSFNALVAHTVGSGKTFTLAAAVMLLRSYGLSQKNLVVVPNGIVSQWVNMFKRLYPEAKLLVVSRDTFKVKDRERVTARIKNEDFDAIIMSHSVFEHFPLRPVYRKGRGEERAYSSKHHYQIKTKFEDLGITALFIDECQAFKNIALRSGINQVRGLARQASWKADEALAKIRWVQKQGGRVVLATGTAITNAVTDLYVWQTMLQAPALKLSGLQTLDRWIGTFSERTSNYELDVDGSSLRWVSRFKTFTNLPELTTMLSSFVDYYPSLSPESLPLFEGYTDTEVPMSKEQELVYDAIRERAEAIRLRKAQVGDNMLRITHDSRDAALDVRLICENLECSNLNKVSHCAQKVRAVYDAGASTQTTQLIFCDIHIEKPAFNLYRVLREALVQVGIPGDEIAVIHDYNTDKRRESLADMVATGCIRIVIGTTQKLGTGTNFQERLAAIHHLSVPWSPYQVTQRDGRIMRFGNTCESVKVYRYYTAGSFDGYSWQLLEVKQGIIDQFMSGSPSMRRCEDPSSTVLSCAEIKALSIKDPVLKERAELEIERARKVIQRQGRVQERELLKNELGRIPDELRKLLDLADLLRLDLKALEGNSAPTMSLEARESWGEALLSAVAMVAAEAEGCNPEPRSHRISHRSFNVFIPPDVDANRPVISLSRKSTYKVILGNKAGGVLTRIDNRLERIAQDLEQVLARIEALRAKQAKTTMELSREDTFDEEIAAIDKRLYEISLHLGLDKEG